MFKRGNEYKINPEAKNPNDFIRASLYENKTFILLDDVVNEDTLYRWRLTSDLPEEEKEAGYITVKPCEFFIPVRIIKNLPADMKGTNICHLK